MGDESRLRAVVELAQGMAAAHGLPEAARAAAVGARAALDGAFAAVSVWERERGRLRVLVNTGEPAEGEEEFPADESYPVRDFPEMTEAPHAEWARGGAGARVESAAGSGGGRRAAALRRRGRGSCVVAPIVLHGRAWGELYVERAADAAVFGRADAEFASVLAAVIAAGVVQYERLAEARRLAFTDPLTGLANRRAVDIRLEEALEEHHVSGVPVSLVVCDINGLKRVNDTYGHAAGDRLLERFGAVLSVCGAEVPGALAARLGGDEFCLLAVGAGAGEVERAAREICRRALGLGLGEGVACGVASTGEAIGAPRSARRLFRLADAAQYRAKAAGSAAPVVAGRGGPHDEVVALADAPEDEGRGRRRFRGRAAAHAPRPGDDG
ncbi:GGDEF domain-containing protein [Streptomyces marincola]|uniref:GGDEF domain-containing protein n=1 Tax=Streptomyces marincola TaxID=2878388 RepID=UPI001CF49E6D|nr:GGDEF domain-containing protein [Streptomyces marincola]UCM90028.1 GGDEF domain-containing protein [Streptomyces marincola]